MLESLVSKGNLFNEIKTKRNKNKLNKAVGKKNPVNSFIVDIIFPEPVIKCCPFLIRHCNQRKFTSTSK